jgi:hypothetical protein
MDRRAVTPEEMLEALEGRLDEARLRQSMEKALQASMKGVRVRGHQMSMDGVKVRVRGPEARSVAAEAGRRMRKAAKAALREALL